ncbi:MAG: hypothetical protein ABR505_05120 [Actinomycetota bacterium]
MKRAFAVSLTIAILGVICIGGPGPAGAKSKLVVVGKDKPGDWGDTIGPEVAPLGDILGQDLIEAAIGMADPETVNFVIKVTSLPPTDGVPEFTRYTWEMNIDGKLLVLDGKFTDYTRATCDPSAGNCPPPRNPGPQPFLVRGDCETDASGLVSCTERGIVKGIFDASAGTITIPVPIDLLEAKPGSTIKSATIIFGSVTAQPAVRGSYTGFPFDRLIVSKAFVVPRG